MDFSMADFRYDAFSQTITAFAIGYTPNPKEVHVIPASAPYEIHLNEIPRGDSPSTLLINIQAGADFEEVSFSTVPSEGQFRAVYGADIVPPVSIVGQGTVQFNAADAGKTVECAYYGLGAIVQKQLFNQMIDGVYGTPDFTTGLIASKIKTNNIYTAIKKTDLGDWNMVSTPSISVVHGITNSKILGQFVTIREDDNTQHYNVPRGPDAFIGNSYLGASTVERLTGGIFDHTDFDSTSYNRGWHTILYEV